MTEPLLRVESLVKHFPLGKGRFVAAVSDVSFEIQRGETLGLVGESGSGKTTVGRCMSRLIEPTSGAITFQSQEITQLADRDMRRLRSRIQLVFQDPSSSLNPRQTVEQAVGEPLILEGKLDAAERLARIRDTLELVDLPDRYLLRYSRQLTASEQQRVMIARAIATRPDLIILDEPTASLDQTARAEILRVLTDLQAEFQIAYLFISHDLTAVEQLADRISIMYLGRLVESAACDQLFRQHRHPYTKGLLSSVLYPDPTRALPPLQLKGEIPSAINPRDECPLCRRCPIEESVCSTTFPGAEEVEPGHTVHCFRWRDVRAGEVRNAGANR